VGYVLISHKILTSFSRRPRISYDVWGLPIILPKPPSLRKQSIYPRRWCIGNGMSYLIISSKDTLMFAQGISYLGNPLVTPFTIRYQKYQRHMILMGWLICIVALLSSSFATKLWHLIITQGVLYGIGIVIIYYPMLSMLNEWFVKRRGLAYGLM
jgi:MFS family permease